MRSSFVLVALLVAVASASAAPEPLVEQVRKSIDKAKTYLIAQRGNWENDAVAAQRPGGCTALALLALLNAGVEPSDPVIVKGLEYLRKVPQTFTYVVALRVMVLCRLNDKNYQADIQSDVDWLTDPWYDTDPDTKKRTKKRGPIAFHGWTYQQDNAIPDASNTQYALLALHEARVAGIPIDPDVWKSIRDYYVNTQTSSGSYGYHWNWAKHEIAESPLSRTGGASFSMSTAGLCGLIIAGNDLNANRETPNGDGTWKNCGKYEEDRYVTKALDWMGVNFPATDGRIEQEVSPYYTWYGIERAGRLTGMRFIGKHDWYRVGCEWLVSKKLSDGSWPGRSTVGGSIVNTSFALLFLSKGRTPILISKLTHLPENDWNNDRADARNLVDFATRELFKGKPMGWQVFNASEADRGRTGDDLAAELLQSPIAYFNGHKAPSFKNGNEIDMLEEFVLNGGVILAEACCGSKDFDTGFHEMIEKRKLFRDEKNFPNMELKQLDENHAVWTAAGPKFAVSPANRRRFPLWGIEMGCKTVVIYSPNDLSCRWESNQFADKGDNQIAFNIGVNIIAYATGLEPPKDRLTLMQLKDESAEPIDVPRGFLKVGLVIHKGDFKVAHEAMPNLLRELRSKSGLDVSLKVEEVDPTRREILDYRFLYMHGRKNFALPKNKLDNLHFNLEHGGLLFADACCGSPEFDTSFQHFILDLWPKAKLEQIPLKDPLFSEDLNGTAITSVRCRRKVEGKTDAEYQNYEPFLQGVKIGGRWVVIYSRWDIGCAWRSIARRTAWGTITTAPCVWVGRRCCITSVRELFSRELLRALTSARKSSRLNEGGQYHLISNNPRNVK